MQGKLVSWFHWAAYGGLLGLIVGCIILAQATVPNTRRPPAAILSGPDVAEDGEASKPGVDFVARTDASGMNAQADYPAPPPAPMESVPGYSDEGFAEAASMAPEASPPEPPSADEDPFADAAPNSNVLDATQEANIARKFIELEKLDDAIACLNSRSELIAKATIADAMLNELFDMVRASASERDLSKYVASCLVKIANTLPEAFADPEARLFFLRKIAALYVKIDRPDDAFTILQRTKEAAAELIMAKQGAINRESELAIRELREKLRRIERRVEDIEGNQMSRREEPRQNLFKAMSENNRKVEQVSDQKMPDPPPGERSPVGGMASLPLLTGAIGSVILLFVKAIIDTVGGSAGKWLLKILRRVKPSAQPQPPTP
jgi:hypothetical protein